MPSKRGWLDRLALLSLCLLLSGCGGVLGAMGLAPKRVDRVPPDLPPGFGSGAPLRVLLFSKTAGFRHAEAIPACDALVQDLAAEAGWDVFASENAAVFDDALLARFDVIVGNNITGDNWTDPQKAAFRRWVEGGGGFVGIHGAAGTRYEYWDWYQETLIGARFSGHPMSPQLQTATMRIADRGHPATRHLRATWQREDEWYSFATNPRERGVRVLATLDESTYEPVAWMSDLRMGDHPIVWSHCVGSGRSFYSALGHRAAYYAEPAHQQMIAGAIRWAGGLEGECAHPIRVAEPAAASRWRAPGSTRSGRASITGRGRALAARSR